jgi:N-acetylneuraminic acid mutarotase
VLTDGLHYLGGSNSFVSETIYQEHDVYDPVSQTWKSSPTNIPDGDAWGAGAHVYENRLYLIGGYPGGSRMRVYDSSTNTWTPAGSLPETFQWGFASGIIGQALYVFGGEPNASRNAPGYKYDFVSQSWSSVARIPFNEGRGALSSGVVGDKMYVLNGNAPDGTTILQIYDSSSNSWSLGLSLSGHHFEAAAVAVEGSRVTFFGGADDHDCADSGSAAVLSDSVNVFDTVLGTWSTLPPMNLPKMWATAQFFKGKFYVLGGFDQDSFQMNDLGIYTP